MKKIKIASLKALDQWKVEDVHQRTVLIQQKTPQKSSMNSKIYMLLLKGLTYNSNVLNVMNR
jgi:hypothetical protein